MERGDEIRDNDGKWFDCVGIDQGLRSVSCFFGLVEDCVKSASLQFDRGRHG